MQNQNNQSINIPSGATLDKIPYSQTNTIGMDPTPGFICFFGFLILLFIILKRCEQHYLEWFEYKKHFDKLELDLKYEKGKCI